MHKRGNPISSLWALFFFVGPNYVATLPASHLAGLLDCCHREGNSEAQRSPQFLFVDSSNSLSEVTWNPDSDSSPWSLEFPASQEAS